MVAIARSAAPSESCVMAPHGLHLDGRKNMLRHDLALAPPSRQTFAAPCFHCQSPFDLLSADLCNCISRERTLRSGQGAGCAREASSRARVAFWPSGPPTLCRRRRTEEGSGVARLLALDRGSVPRPLALIVADATLVLTVAARALRSMG